MNLWLIPLLPAAGAALNGLFGRRFSKRAVWMVGLAFVAAAMLYAWWIALRFAALPESAVPYVENYGTWFLAGSFRVPYGLQLDQLSLLMVLIVTGVGFLIHVYSVGYMADEGGYYRFFSYLNLFTFFMLTLVLANNYLLMFVGWEGVGLCSYLLIGFFFLRDSASAAGKKAFIVNRIGDFGFLIALFLIIRHFGTVNFADVFSAARSLPIESASAGAGLLTAIALLLLAGATGKSAQLPLYVWLPDAMEGPTPVSALIHAATMVTAGVYMIARSHVIFERAPIALTVVAVIGCATALFAATIALVQNDIKRVLAYSTVSQLGYMVMACGVAAFSAGMFHLMTHAFFKALLFLAAGSVIHGLGGEQDMRRMGGLRKQLPVTFWTMTAATLAIAGAPLFSGFFSKDEILYRAYTSSFGGWGYWAVGVFAALLTAFYMFRLWFMTFFGEYRGEAAHAAAPPAPHSTPLLPGEARVEVITTTKHEAAVLEELQKRQGQVTSIDRRGQAVVVRAAVPQKMLLYLQSELENVTDSHAAVSIEFGALPVASAPHAEPAHHGPHESPWVMLVPLIVLAVLSVIGGWVGVPQALGGSNRFERFLEPVFRALPAGAAELPPTGLETRQPSGAPAELTFSLIATGAALVGFLLAWLMYYKRRDLPQAVAARARGLYALLANKYWVDELYAAWFVRPVIEGSRQLLWKGVDVFLIDDSLNETAAAARDVSDAFRRMQSGYIRSYAGWVAAGAAVVIAYMVWLGVR